MATIKLTAKRQATFPIEVCEALGVQSGEFDGMASSASRERDGQGAEASRQTPLFVDRLSREMFPKREGTVEPRETQRFRGAGPGLGLGGMKSALDTSFIVRLVTEDPPDQAAKAREELERCLRGADRPRVADIAIIEACLAFQTHYSVPKAESARGASNALGERRRRAYGLRAYRDAGDPQSCVREAGLRGSRHPRGSPRPWPGRWRCFCLILFSTTILRNSSVAVHSPR